MWTTNKLLQTALRKWMHNNRQPEVVVVTDRHTVGENGLGLNWPRHHYQIVQEVLYQQWFRWHRRWCIVWQIQHWLLGRRRWRVWWNGDTRTDTTDVQWREWWWILGIWINMADFSPIAELIWPHVCFICYHPSLKKNLNSEKIVLCVEYHTSFKIK